MADILSADFSSTTLEALYKQKLKKGDLLGALLITDRMQKNGMGESELSLKRAKVYYDMQKYDASADEWIKFLSVQQDERSYARAYNGLGAALGKEELYDILREQGEIRVECEYCDKTYVYNKDDVDKLLGIING